MEMKLPLFGIKLGKHNKPLSYSNNQKRKLRSFAPPFNDDDSITVEAVGGFFGYYLDMDGTIRTDGELIQRYREMSMHAEVEAGIEDIVCEAIVSDRNQDPVKIVLDNIDLSDKVKQKITKEFSKILDLLNFRNKGYEIFRRWYVDSKIVFHIMVDEKNPDAGIAELRFIDPVNIQKVREVEKERDEKSGRPLAGKINEYYIYSRDGFLQNDTRANRISPDAVCYVTSGLFDSRNRRTVGYLHKAIKPLNQLKMMEDAVVIYRLSRSPERRIFYVDVGNLPKNKADQYLRDLMNRHRNKLRYDASTGEVRDDKRYMSLLEDYWIPRREGGKGTEVTTLPGAQNLSEIEDVKYFMRKLFQSLNIPFSRLENEQKSFSIGRTTEITRDELKFSKFIARLRSKFSEVFYNLLKTQLLLKNIITSDDWEEIKSKIYFDFLSDTYFSELKMQEMNREKIETLTSIEPYIGKYFSDEWIYKNVLCFNDEEIAIMKKQIKKDKKEKELLQNKDQPPASPENPFPPDQPFNTQSKPDLSKKSTQVNPTPNDPTQNLRFDKKNPSSFSKDLPL